MVKVNAPLAPLPNAYGPYPDYPDFHEFHTNETLYRFTYLKKHVFELMEIEGIWWGHYYHEHNAMKIAGTIGITKWKDLDIAFTLTTL